MKHHPLVTNSIVIVGLQVTGWDDLGIIPVFLRGFLCITEITFQPLALSTTTTHKVQHRQT